MAANLAEFLAQFALQEADTAAARKQALMMAGMGLLGARKGREGEAFARAGLLGMDTYNQGLEGARQGKIDKYKLASEWEKMQEAERLRKKQEAEQEAIRAQLGGAFAPQSPLTAMGPGGPTPDNLQRVQNAPPPDQVDQYRKAAEVYARAGNLEGAAKMAAIADNMEQRREYSTTPQTVLDSTGKPVLAQFNKQGKQKIATDVAPPPDLMLVNTGGQQTFVNKLTTPPGTQYNMTMTPDQADSSKRGWAQIGLERDKFGYQKTKDAAAPGGGKEDKPTEAQGTAGMYYGMMLSAAKAIDSMPLPNLAGVALAKGSLPWTPAAFQNFLAGPEGQKYAQASLQWAEAMLRITTGATAPPEEVKRTAMTYFPQIGDTPEVIKQKNAARAHMQAVLRVKAGDTMAGKVEGVMGNSGGVLKFDAQGNQIP
jgi:hypothetical protein